MKGGRRGVVRRLLCEAAAGSTAHRQGPHDGRKPARSRRGWGGPTLSPFTPLAAITAATDDITTTAATTTTTTTGAAAAAATAAADSPPSPLAARRTNHTGAAFLPPPPTQRRPRKGGRRARRHSRSRTRPGSAGKDTPPKPVGLPFPVDGRKGGSPGGGEAELGGAEDARVSEGSLPLGGGGERKRRRRHGDRPPRSGAYAREGQKTGGSPGVLAGRVTATKDGHTAPPPPPPRVGLSAVPPLCTTALPHPLLPHQLPQRAGETFRTTTSSQGEEGEGRRLPSNSPPPPYHPPPKRREPPSACGAARPFHRRSHAGGAHSQQATTRTKSRRRRPWPPPPRRPWSPPPRRKRWSTLVTAGPTAGRAGGRARTRWQARSRCTALLVGLRGRSRGNEGRRRGGREAAVCLAMSSRRPVLLGSAWRGRGARAGSRRKGRVSGCGGQSGAEGGFLAATPRILSAETPAPQHGLSAWGGEEAGPLACICARE